MTDADDPIVTVQHLHAANLCMRGARMWFSQQGLDFADFLKNGMRASAAEATGDALGRLVAGVARRQANGED